MQQALAAFDPPIVNVVRARLANESFAAIAERGGWRIERAFRAFHTVQRRVSRRFPDGGSWALAIPDDPSQVAGWFERHLMGTRMSELIGELRAVHSETAGRAVFIGPLLAGRRRSAILERGLAELSPRRLSALLTHPQLLLSLQELVLNSGGVYWDEVQPIDERLEALVEQSWAMLSAA